MAECTQNEITIPTFFENKSIFITGATGFVGRILVEKLLRSCPGIKNIYVLLRPKRGKNIEDRIKDITDITLFEKLRLENKYALNKIVPIAGNLEQIGLGISKEDKSRIVEHVTIIFHVAASVRFDDLLKTAIFVNTRSAREVMLLARQLKKVDVFVDTSTAYCNSDNSTIKEQLYPAKFDWKELIAVAEECDEELLETMTPKCIEPLPNTYTWTKSIAEHVVVDLSKGLVPTVIVRPTIVVPTYSDPIPGWIDNFNGSAGLVIGVGKGVIRALYTAESSTFNNVFADSVVKALIISAWKKALSCDKNKVSIYNAASDFNFSSADQIKFGWSYQSQNPLENSLWPPNARFCKSYYAFYTLTWIYQLIPALLVDGLLRLFGKHPILWKIQRKAYLANLMVRYFTEHLWNFENQNYLSLRDSLLKSDIESFYFAHFGPVPTQDDYETYFQTFYDGCRNYLAKEGPVAEKTIKREKRLRVIENIWILSWIGVALYCIFFKYELVSALSNKLYDHFETL